MEFYVGGRQAGKTHKLVEWVREGKRIKHHPYWSRVIITHSEAEANRIRTHYNLEFGQVFSSHYWLSKEKLGSSPEEVALDNTDLILQQLFGPVTLTTMTGRTI